MLGARESFVPFVELLLCLFAFFHSEYLLTLRQVTLTWLWQKQALTPVQRRLASTQDFR